MHEVQVTVVGNVATQVDFRTSASGVAVARFRLASTVRRFDAAREAWAEKWTSFFTVWAWRSLAGNVASSVALGEPLIVQGQLRVEDVTRDERRYTGVDLLATAIGHDLARGTCAFVRNGPGRSRASPAASPAGVPPGGALLGGVSSAGAPAALPPSAPVPPAAAPLTVP